MRTLLVLRHAKSGHDEPVPDKQRTLTARGKKDARRMGELARERDLLPNRVLCSTATRARETFELFSEGGELEGPADFVDALYLAEPKAIVRELAARGGTSERVMVVGHNPGLEELVSELTSERTELSTTAFAVCALPIESWAELDLGTAGHLVTIFRPKDER
ncbi:MAG TPA: histidine phosphatase family protein [Polyangiaceae bacterium]|nr:histidine phosphatase family protein [Polyangiaceae bacterium]